MSRWNSLATALTARCQSSQGAMAAMAKPAAPTPRACLRRRSSLPGERPAIRE